VIAAADRAELLARLAVKLMTSVLRQRVPRSRLEQRVTHRRIISAVLPPDATRDLVLDRVGDLAETTDQIGRTRACQIGPDRCVTAGDVEPDANDGDLFAVSRDAANRHDVPDVAIGHEGRTPRTTGNVLQLRECLPFVFPKDSNFAHGGNPMASFTAEYSGCTRPS
jgi:hypothetical protein